MSLRNKILLFSVLPVSLLMVLVVTIGVLQLRSNMIETAKDRMRGELRSAARVINEGNRKAMAIARMMASAERNGLFGRREESMRLARDILVANPRFIGTSIGYEPDADGQDRTWRMRRDQIGVSTNSTGRFLAYFFRDPAAGGTITAEPLVATGTALYYEGLRQQLSENPTADCIVTEPHIYNGRNLIVEQTCAIQINGKFVGVAGVDRSLEFLDKFLQQLRPAGSVELVLVSSRGRIIAASGIRRAGERDLRTARIEDLYLDENGAILTGLLAEKNGKLVFDQQKATSSGRTTLRGDLKDLLGEFVRDAGNGIVKTFLDPVTGNVHFGASARIPIGGWTLMMFVDSNEVTAPIRRTTRWIVLLAFLGLALVIMILVWLANLLRRRLDSISKLTDRVAEGDLTVDLSAKSSDEIGKLERAIGDMVLSLDILVGKVKKASRHIEMTSAELASGSNRQEQAVNDLASSATEITVSAKEISATARELLGTMKDLTRTAEETASLAGAGHEGLTNMAETMGAMMAATESASSQLALIGEKTGGIRDVVTTIVQVADQTNLLSINASVEANKAGKQGRGFAVIGRQIRLLADQTAVATLEIEQTMKRMGTALASCLGKMQSFATEAKATAGEVEQVCSQASRIIEQGRTLSTHFTVLTEGMKSQSDGARQISDAMVDLSEGVRQTADSLKDFRRARADLDNEVANLRREIARFKMEETTDGGGNEENRREGLPEHS